jgi:tripartite-type tricarboxylate transporter receptor subunit TctC
MTEKQPSTRKIWTCLLSDRSLVVLSIVVACVLATVQRPRAEDYPSRPVKLLVGAPPGGTTDTVARALAEPMATALRQPVVVDNRPGAGGNLAADAVAKSAPDGHTLLVSFTRQPSFPDLPAIGEIVPGFESSAWFGVFAPANLPAAITDKLNGVIVTALGNAKLREHLEHEGAAPVGSTSAEFAAFVREDIKRWAPLVKALGATPN